MVILVNLNVLWLIINGKKVLVKFNCVMYLVIEFNVILLNNKLNSVSIFNINLLVKVWNLILILFFM